MSGRTPCVCKVPPVWVLNRCGRSTKTGELQQRSRRNRRRPFDGTAAQRRHMGRTRTLGRQRRRQQRHDTTHRLFIVGMRTRIKIDFGRVAIAAARSLQRLCRSVVEHAAAACAMIGALVAPVHLSARMLFCDAPARERHIGSAARRQQIDSKQQQRYVSSPGHTFRTIRPRERDRLQNYKNYPIPTIFRFVFSLASSGKPPETTRYFIFLAAPKILTLGKMQASLFLPSLIRIFVLCNRATRKYTRYCTVIGVSTTSAPCRPRSSARSWPGTTRWP